MEKVWLFIGVVYFVTFLFSSFYITWLLRKILKFNPLVKEDGLLMNSVVWLFCIFVCAIPVFNLFLLIKLMETATLSDEQLEMIIKEMGDR